MIRKSQSSFIWQPTTANLKIYSDQGYQYIDLNPSITLAQQFQINVRLDTERELQHSGDLGWNWHKSWNLPNISLKMNVQTSNTTQDAQWPFCQVHLYAVKHVTDELYEDVGLEGNTSQELIDGKAFFSGIKFNSTTYNHQGHRFQLMIMIRHQDQVLLSLISPKIFVDSRKSARDEHRQIQYIQPFDARQLDRQFCKKEKHFNDVVDAVIENNENGLHNYLTAPNIRNKIKHPLFLVLKFSKCLNLYCQESISQLSPQELIIKFQSQLMKREENQFILVLSLNNNRIKKKIEEQLTSLLLQSKVQVIEKKHLNESEFKCIKVSEDDYNECYQELLNMMQQYYDEQNQNDHEECQQQIVQPQIMNPKKFKKDFDKLPTKTFDEISTEKPNVKVEEEFNIQQQQQLFNQQLLMSNLVQEQAKQAQFQEQVLQYFLFQQQFMMQLLMNQH